MKKHLPDYSGATASFQDGYILSDLPYSPLYARGTCMEAFYSVVALLLQQDSFSFAPWEIGQYIKTAG